MTLKELYEAVLMELNKENAPNITLEKFNYLANKSYKQYVNKRYNIYDINQQTTDDLRVLKASAILPVRQTRYRDKVVNILSKDDESSTIINTIKDHFNFMDATYTVELPDDYLHLLNCECFYKVNHTHKCNNKDTIARAKATRLTADSWNMVVDNFWNKPEYNRPYYYIHNVNTELDVPTNPVKQKDLEQDDKLVALADSGTDRTYWEDDPDIVGDKPKELASNKSVSEKEYLADSIESKKDPFKIIDINGFIEDSDQTKHPQKKAQVRYGNASKVLMEIRYGQDNSVYELIAVLVDYIKTPQHLRLTQEQLDKTLDTSQVLEFPDYVCQEIVNELVLIIMENISDQRLQSHPVVSQSIANPAQQQTS